ncbi:MULTISPECIES: manganese catalase family protein [Dehalobacter]|jgi:Mn-containing catalase|uniref:Mn-containing catalase n=2 Tax=Dehalobacter restrictus TaxID=55583 RepID=A0A857DJL8_9FIRM|nr:MULTISPECIES: manganese catalase family protein [Dehalobacter]AHF10521.1 Mn-containing catalase [Dehalobacter restrictus DSM 9455]MCG1025444.1 manganese catalase family protein [Dehalobacter sp.]MDJ0305689.1 manganese catalase family protein [Dehalobacter sp.]OCZ51117.1 Mn-containing catalase [Dehalobacter sp. TeCB1]QHA01147.1 Mn-containing catalase [Dehalobacter restrictus]
MFSYQKRLLYPVYVEQKNEKLAWTLLEHIGGKDGEFTAFTRHMYQRLHVINPYIRDLLGMIASEELAHMEIIAAVVRKLGLADLPLANSGQESWNMEYVEKSTDINEMLKIDEEAEIRAKRLYLRHLTLTEDTSLKKVLQFLVNREEVHQRLLRKSGVLVAQEANNEQFSTLIHEYKMSLRVMK